jgi:hypothetical protein
VTYVSDVGGPLLAAVFQIRMDNTDSAKGYRNQTYRNIRVEAGRLGILHADPELKNTVYAGAAPRPPIPARQQLRHRLREHHGHRQSEVPNPIKGLDANNGWHNVVLVNFVVNGQAVNAANPLRTSTSTALSGISLSRRP